MAERPRVMTYPKLARVLRWKRNGIERLTAQAHLHRFVTVESGSSIKMGVGQVLTMSYIVPPYRYGRRVPCD